MLATPDLLFEIHYTDGSPISSQSPGRVDNNLYIDPYHDPMGIAHTF